MSIDVKLVQFWNALPYIVVTEEGTEKDSKLEQPRNASVSI